MIWVMLLFLVLFLLFAIGPVWYRAKADAEQASVDELDEYAAENLRLYQERLQELEEVQEFTDAEKQQFKLELDREFLASEQFKGYQQQANSDVKGRLWLPLAMSAVLAFAGLGLYSFWGANAEIEAAQLLKEFSTNPNFSKTDELNLLNALDKAAHSNSKNFEWGYYNGRVNMEFGNYAKARSIFKDLLAALPLENEQDRVVILNMLFQATFFANDQKPSAEVYQILKESLAIEPNQPQFLGLAGMIAFENSDYQSALKYWKTLWQSLPDDANSEIIAQGIQRAAQRLEEQGETVDLKFLQRTKLTIKVDISPEAKASAPANTVVFVSAVAFEGSPMPLAAQRITLADLPATVVLTDAQAVMPNMTLSAFEQVTIKATLSVSGQPSAQAGDWQGELSPVQNNHQGVLDLLINKQIK